MGMYFYLLKKKKLKTLEQQLDYFKDKSAEKMTVQDKDVWSKIFEFID